MCGCGPPGNDKTFAGHTSPVFCLFIKGDFLFSGAGDCAVRVWDVASASVSLPPTLNRASTTTRASSGLHACLIPAVRIFGAFCAVLIYTCAGQCLLHLPGSPGESDILKSAGHMDWVNAIYATGDYFFSGSVDRTIRR